MSQPIALGTVLGGRYKVVASLTSSPEGDHVLQGEDQILRRRVSILVPSTGHESFVVDRARSLAGGAGHSGFQVLDMGQTEDSTYLVTSYYPADDLLDALLTHHDDSEDDSLSDDIFGGSRTAASSSYIYEEPDPTQPQQVVAAPDAGSASQPAVTRWDPSDYDDYDDAPAAPSVRNRLGMRRKVRPGAVRSTMFDREASRAGTAGASAAAGEIDPTYDGDNRYESYARTEGKPGRLDERSSAPRGNERDAGGAGPADDAAAVADHGRAASSTRDGNSPNRDGASVHEGSPSPDTAGAGPVEDAAQTVDTGPAASSSRDGNSPAREGSPTRGGSPSRDAAAVAAGSRGGASAGGGAAAAGVAAGAAAAGGAALGDAAAGARRGDGAEEAAAPTGAAAADGARTQHPETFRPESARPENLRAGASAATAAGATGSTETDPEHEGAGAGDGDEPVDTAEDRRKGPLRWLLLLLLVLALVAVIVLCFRSLGSLTSQFSQEGPAQQNAAPGEPGGPAVSSSPSSNATPEIVGVTRVTADPNFMSDTDATLNQATDGNPATYWLSYGFSNAQFGSLVQYVGLAAQLEEPAPVQEITVQQANGSGGQFTVYVSDSPSLDGAEKVGSGSFTGPEIRVPLSDAARTKPHEYVLVVWDQLPQLTSPIGGYQYGLRIGELAVR